MSKPNDRPMIMGDHGLITSGHYLATAAGYRIAMQGGNAADIAAAVGLCLSVVEQQENSPGGEVPVLVYSAKEKKTFAVSGVGCAPKAFSIEWCKQNQIDLIPGDGYLPACVPAVIDTWATVVERFGTMSFSQVIQPALELAEQGFPMYTGLQRALTFMYERIMNHYPSTGEVYLPGGKIPAIGERIRNPDLA